MISDVSRYHGSFFSLLIDRHDGPIVVEKMVESGAGFYLLDGKLPVYLKHSSARRSPWVFNFSRAHQQAHQRAHENYGSTILGLICGKDGIVGLLMDDLRGILNQQFDDQECIMVYRKIKGMYELRGKDGNLGSRISRHNIFEIIKTNLRV